MSQLSKGRNRRGRQSQRNHQKHDKGGFFRSKMLLLFALIAFSMVTVLYGPYDGFRIFWITTAMHTSDHQFLAKLIYSQKTINQVMQGNVVIALDERSSPLVNISKEKNDTIERIEVEVASGDGFLLKIHDPARVSVACSDKAQGQLLEEISSSNQAVAATNASAYQANQQKGLPLGLVISDSKIINQGLDPRHSIIGLNQKNELVLGIYFDWDLDQLALRDAVEYGPFLIINGKKAGITGNGGGLAPRTAIGQTEDGSILLLVIDGRKLETFGATMKDVQDVLFDHGAINAACLDGGASVSMFFEGQIINSVNSKEENRKLPNAFIVQ